MENKNSSKKHKKKLFCSFFITLFLPLYLTILFGCATPPSIEPEPQKPVPKPGEPPEATKPPLSESVASVGETNINYSCRGYLTKNIKESEGYGLYSYILFNGEHRSDQTQYERYLRLYREYEDVFRICKIVEEEENVQKENINCIFWPLRLSISFEGLLALEENEEKHSFFITNYNYIKSDVMLSWIEGFQGKPEVRRYGPYLFGYNKMRDGENPEREMLLVDFTMVSKESFRKILEWYRKKVKDDPKTWLNGFDWDLIKIHAKDAFIRHSRVTLIALEWTGKFFGVKEVFAKDGQN